MYWTFHTVETLVWICCAVILCCEFERLSILCCDFETLMVLLTDICDDHIYIVREECSLRWVSVTYQCFQWPIGACGLSHDDDVTYVVTYLLCCDLRLCHYFVIDIILHKTYLLCWRLLVALECEWYHILKTAAYHICDQVEELPEWSCVELNVKIVAAIQTIAIDNCCC